MNKPILFASALLLALSLSASFSQDKEKKLILVKEKLLTRNSYLIVARGYSMEGSNRPADSAKEAALLNAQILAKERFDGSFDVVKNGKADKYVVRENSADVHYVLTWRDIKRHLVKK